MTERLKPWLVLGSSIVFATIVIMAVNRDARWQRERLRAGLAADEDRRRKKRENIEEHERQQKIYESLISAEN